jgi:hypothetical protein
VSRWIGVLRGAALRQALQAGGIGFDWVTHALHPDVAIQGWHLDRGDTFTLADVDGDGRQELVVISQSGEWIGVLAGADGGLVCTWIGHDWVNHPRETGATGWDLKRGDEYYVADIDGDGHELVVVSANGEWIGILRSLDGGLVCTSIGHDWVNRPGETGATGWDLRQTDHFVVAALDGGPTQQLIAVSVWRLRSVVILSHEGSRGSRAPAPRHGASAERGVHANEVGVEVASAEPLDSVISYYPEITPRGGEGVTNDEALLFARRAPAESNEVVVYFVGATLPPVDGVATDTDGGPAAIITTAAPPHTLAHEPGHLLGLNHLRAEPCLSGGAAPDALDDSLRHGAHR